LPNARLVGLAPSRRLDACPVPERLITSGEGVPFVVSVIEPLRVPDDDGSNVALKAVLPPAAIVVDVLRPVWPNPAPVTLICENVSVMFPLFFNVIGCEFVFPTVTVPNATLDGVAEIWACTPAPLSTMVAGDPGALLVIKMLPEALPLAFGVNVTVNVVFAPALIEVGCKLIACCRLHEASQSR